MDPKPSTMFSRTGKLARGFSQRELLMTITQVVVDPGHHGPFCAVLENRVTPSGPSTVGFDLLGRPQYAGAISCQLAANGTAIATVSVAADIGFVTTTELQ